MGDDSAIINDSTILEDMFDNRNNNAEFPVYNEGCLYEVKRVIYSFMKMENQIVFLSFIVIVINYADRTNISTAIVEMKEEFQWSNKQVGMVLSAFYYGYAINQIPSGWISQKIGGQTALFIALCLWSIFTIATPLVVTDMWSLIICRVMMGASESFAFPAAHQLISKWVPQPQQSRAVSIVTSGCYFGSVLSLYIVPLLITYYGWRSAFYMFGILGLMSSVLLYSSDSAKEGFCAYLRKQRIQPVIHNEIEENESKEMRSSPTSEESIIRTCIHLISYKQVWAIIINQWCNSWGFYIILNWIPLYYHQVMSIPLSDQGVLLIGPYLLQGITAFPAGWIADYLISNSSLKVTEVRRVMQVGGMIFPALFLIIFIMIPSKFGAVISLVFGLGLNSMTLAGVSVYQHDLSPRYAGLIFAIGNTAGNLSGIVAVYITGWLLQEIGSWDLIFWIAIGNYVTGALIWYLWAFGDTPLIQSPKYT